MPRPARAGIELLSLRRLRRIFAFEGRPVDATSAGYRLGNDLPLREFRHAAECRQAAFAWKFVDLRVEFRRPDGTTAVASQFHRIRLSSSATKYEARLNNRVDLNRQGLPSVVRAIIGLSFMEDWGRWSDANISEAVEFHFNSDLPENFDLVIHYWAFGPMPESRSWCVAGNDRGHRRFQRARNSPGSSPPLTRARVITITPPYPTRPADLGENNDQRRLGIALISVQIEEAGGALPANLPHRRRRPPRDKSVTTAPTFIPLCESFSICNYITLRTCFQISV